MRRDCNFLDRISYHFRHHFAIRARQSPGGMFRQRQLPIAGQTRQTNNAAKDRGAAQKLEQGHEVNQADVTGETRHFAVILAGVSPLANFFFAS
jgi:hypothetical protein